MLIPASLHTTPAAFYTQLGAFTRRTTISSIRGDSAVFDFVFDRGDGIVEIGEELDPGGSPALSSFIFGAKEEGKLRGDYIVSNWNGTSFAWTKINGSVFTDGTTTATSKNFGSATATLTQDDVGLPISGAGIPAGATIESVTSASTGTLSIAATATATGVTLTITGRAVIYRVIPDFNSVELNDLLIDGTVNVIASEAARYALPTNTPVNTIYRQTSNNTYWKVVTPASIGVSGGWSDEVPVKTTITLDCQLELVLGGNRTSTAKASLTIENDVIYGGEGVPISANPEYPSPAQLIRWRSDLTGFIGGGATNLDGLVTTTLSAGYVVALVKTSEAIESHWRLDAGTTAESEAGGIVRPDDYAAATNEKIWTRIL